jgi:hypothetical protein
VEVAKHLAYLIEGGEPALLHSTWQPTRPRVETVVITGAEDGSFGDRSGGEQVRFIEVPCGAMGPFGVIDQYRAAGVTDVRAAGQWIKGILTELERHHGHVLPKLAGYLASLGPVETCRILEAHSAKFLRHAARRIGNTDAAGLRRRDAFAFFFAAGMLGAEANAIPWSAETIRGSVLRCLRWHEELTRSKASDDLAPPESATQELLAVLRGRANDSCIASAATLKQNGALYDRRAKEVRATEKFLEQHVGGRRALRACLSKLADENIVLVGDKPPSYLRQVRYPDGRLRVVCFKRDILRSSAREPLERIAAGRNRPKA